MRTYLVGQLALVSLVLCGCGARTKGLDPPIPKGLEAEPTSDGDGGVLCRSVRDCQGSDLCERFTCEEGFCRNLPPLDCDDGNECTEDACDSATGECVNVERTHDNDGDGFRAPLAGFLPGEAGSCGQDCDDTSARAFPGGEETCDGVDNDCDGVVDETFGLRPPVVDPILVSEVGEQATLGGFVHNGEFYALSYSAGDDTFQHRVIGIDSRGSVLMPSAEVAMVNNETYAGPIVWTGRAFGVAWEDRRDDGYEIYFNRLDTAGNKLGADLRVTNAPDFSLNPSLRYTGQEFVLFWQDRRDGGFGIWGQRLTRNGELIGDNLDLTQDLFEAEGPSSAVGRRNLGLVFNAPVDRSLGAERQVVFRTVSFDLTTTSPPIALSEPDGVGASVSYNDGSYVVAWEVYNNGPGDAIWGSVVSEDGEIVVARTRLTEPAPFARSHSLVPMGDRLVLLWAEDNGVSYDIYMRTLAPDLTPLTDKVQITFSPTKALYPAATLGAEGELGVAYFDRGELHPEIYFLPLRCDAATP